MAAAAAEREKSQNRDGERPTSSNPGALSKPCTAHPPSARAALRLALRGPQGSLCRRRCRSGASCDEIGKACGCGHQPSSLRLYFLRYQQHPVLCLAWAWQMKLCYFCTNLVAASLFPGWGGDQLPARCSRRCCGYACSCWYDLYNISARRVLRSTAACSPYADAAYPPVAPPRTRY